MPSKRRGVTYRGEKTTHDTDGLPGYPAVDLFAAPGTAFLAPEDGEIVRLSGRGGTKGQVFGWSIYFVGVSGRTYFITHLGKSRAPIGSYREGQKIGSIGVWSSGDAHAHVGINDSGAAVPAGSSPASGPEQAQPTVQPEDSQSAPAPTPGPPPNAPPVLVPPLPDLPGNAQVALPKDLAEAWKMIANQPLSSPESQRWAKLIGGNEAA